MSMTGSGFIAGDWGTSRLRLYLCDGNAHVLARKFGDGVATADCAQSFSCHVAQWDETYGLLPAVLAGMVGSSIGWREAAYLSCPTKAEAICGRCLRFEEKGRAVAIVPGLSCTNKTGAPDVMRGEETQILGVLRSWPELAQGRRCFCLPGTHTKWVMLEDGAILSFQTALSGEVFELLRGHSILARDSSPVASSNPQFQAGLDYVRLNRHVDLLHLLFSTRSRQLCAKMAKADAASYLSAIVVGADVATAIAFLGVQEEVTLICTAALGELYGAALAPYAISARLFDGDEAALAGLAHIHARLFS